MQIFPKLYASIIVCSRNVFQWGVNIQVLFSSQRRQMNFPALPGPDISGTGLGTAGKIGFVYGAEAGFKVANTFCSLYQGLFFN